MDLSLDENTASWHLDHHGHWNRVHQDEDGRPLRDLQNFLIQHRQRTAAVSR
jgi:polyphosphate kinase